MLKQASFLVLFLEFEVLGEAYLMLSELRLKLSHLHLHIFSILPKIHLRFICAFWYSADVGIRRGVSIEPLSNVPHLKN